MSSCVFYAASLLDINFFLGVIDIFFAYIPVKSKLNRALLFLTHDNQNLL